MRLIDLFEQRNWETLKPGEKRIRTDIQLRDIYNIRRKITNLRDNIWKSVELKNAYSKDTNLQNALNSLIQRLELKISYLERMEDRPSPGADKIINILERESSDYITAVRQASAGRSTIKWFYRGQRGEASVIEGRSRDDRQPKDSNTELSELLDYHLENMGFVALRRNSIFVTTSRSFAESYGDYVYIVFPKNGFHFLSTNERDLVIENISVLADQDMVHKYLKELDNWLKNNIPENSTDELIEELRKYLSWASISVIIMVINRIKDAGNIYNIPDEFFRDLSSFVTDESVRTNLKPNQTDLLGPMESGHEVMIHGEYWAFRHDKWADFLRTRLIDNY